MIIGYNNFMLVGYPIIKGRKSLHAIMEILFLWKKKKKKRTTYLAFRRSLWGNYLLHDAFFPTYTTLSFSTERHKKYFCLEKNCIIPRMVKIIKTTEHEKYLGKIINTVLRHIMYASLPLTYLKLQNRCNNQ